MEIQSQPAAAIVTTGGAAAASNGHGNANGSKAQAAFSAALNGIMSGNAGQEADGAGAVTGLTGMSALIQLLTPLLSTAPATDVQASAVTIEQVDALTLMLKQPEQADALLGNPDVQAWLMQLQALLAAMASTPAESPSTEETLPADTVAMAGEEAASIALSPLLFVPIHGAEQPASEANLTNLNTTAVDASTVSGEIGGNSQISAILQSANNSVQLLTQMQNTERSELSSNAAASVSPQQPAIAQGQAVHLLNQLKALIQTTNNDPELKQILKELPSVLISAAVETSQIHKSSAFTHRLTAVATHANGSTESDASALTELLQVVPNKVQKLEIMAAKTVQPMILNSEPPAASDETLFEPLSQTDLSDVNAQPITVQEFLKQVQTGHAPKMPVLHMPAANFSDDMTQYVVSSFMLDSSAEGFTEAKLSLYPQHLGHVDVKLTMHNGQLVAQFVADNLAGKEMLESQLSQLRTTLQNQGIQVEKLEVSQGQGFQSGMFQDGRQQQQQQSGQSSKQQKSASAKIAALEEVMPDEMNEAAAAAGKPVENGSIDVTA